MTNGVNYDKQTQDRKYFMKTYFDKDLALICIQSPGGMDLILSGKGW